MLFCSWLEVQCGKTFKDLAAALGPEFDLAATASSFFLSSTAPTRLLLSSAADRWDDDLPAREQLLLRDSLSVSCAPKSSAEISIVFIWCWLPFFAGKVVATLLPSEGSRIRPGFFVWGADALDSSAALNSPAENAGFNNLPDKLREKRSRPALVMVSELQRSGWIRSGCMAAAAWSLEEVDVLQLLAAVVTTVAMRSSGFPTHWCLPASGLTPRRRGTGEPASSLSTWINWPSCSLSLNMRSSCSSASVTYVACDESETLI